MKHLNIIGCIFNFQFICVKGYERGYFGWGHSKRFKSLRQVFGGLVVAAGLTTAQNAQAGMIMLPLQQPLKNNIILMRAGESMRDAEGVVETAPEEVGCH